MKRYKITQWNNTDIVIGYYDNESDARKAMEDLTLQKLGVCLCECEDDGENLTEWVIIDSNCDLETGKPDYNVKCNGCGWLGDEGYLGLIEDSEGDLVLVCPNCGTDENLMDI